MAKTTDSGLTWKILPEQFANISDVFFLSDRIGYVFTFTFYGELFKTIDGGDTWKLVSNRVPDNHLSSYILSEKEAYLGGTSGVFHTSDGGITWKQEYEEQGLIVNRIAYNGKSLFAVTNNGKMLTKKINP
ncbi:WD40/YVTN/BNR-like repeat-containing protein [Pedobacter arcticus]|uniref:WD40/YVTN/BNR-like repeat-containing protein n=1 Tax=Pedobacter arcticus TaxID=752140 RepID=UPI000306694E|nr:YCF48-related protein [Pedobacter arcticus]